MALLSTYCLSSPTFGWFPIFRSFGINLRNPLISLNLLRIAHLQNGRYFNANKRFWICSNSPCHLQCNEKILSCQEKYFLFFIKIIKYENLFSVCFWTGKFILSCVFPSKRQKPYGNVAPSGLNRGGMAFAEISGQLFLDFS